jgi:predicted metal-dependent HD superfamily phosphohydrolase
MDLQDIWIRCFADFGTEPPHGAFADVTQRYREAHRAYHTLQHLDECFAYWVETRASAEIGLALFYHDAIYDTHTSDNEEKSAQLAIATLEGALPRAALERIAALILTTKHDAQPQGDDETLLIDIDLAILGAPSKRFDEYERQVRIEYGWVAEADFRSGRARILRSFLDRPILYGTAFLHDKLEAQARSNLRRSLAALAGR